MEAVTIKPHPLKMPIKMVWTAIGMIALFEFGTSAFNANYKIMIDDQPERCIPEYSVYLVKKQYGGIERGKIYAFKAQNMKPYFQDNEIIGKYAVAIEGDKIVQNEQGVFINGELKITGYPVLDKLHVEEESLYTTMTLQHGQVFFSGTAERSYDSRYWGPASQEQIIGEAIPLW